MSPRASAVASIVEAARQTGSKSPSLDAISRPVYQGDAKPSRSWSVSRCPRLRMHPSPVNCCSQHRLRRLLRQPSKCCGIGAAHGGDVLAHQGRRSCSRQVIRISRIRKHPTPHPAWSVVMIKILMYRPNWPTPAWWATSSRASNGYAMPGSGFPVLLRRHRVAMDSHRRCGGPFSRSRRRCRAIDHMGRDGPQRCRTRAAHAGNTNRNPEENARPRLARRRSPRMRSRAERPPGRRRCRRPIRGADRQLPLRWRRRTHRPPFRPAPRRSSASNRCSTARSGESTPSILSVCVGIQQMIDGRALVRRIHP